ncbi:bifunctional diaminohydroxyphosphoribosylaminopyrimidine deaminase/5-amino-6-(5-phosphoribosylamino)uracil reductase RibD [Alicyclobacillus sendaiensis]|uniref:Riboflavin biosynthesis protein RibD n=1 Tax=Alicyclobacillus sendaiensis PA2 TaxID=3029425 RepID=A0ABT6XU66_ALISE|nr:bifunctional diaminohydroxyphosphoribosylaminopyrimidine deaminase/5-amino-6-(5-phosphoribosylamino)uracil reductase RibD [Alicyclobacillus sendaiensis]MDI9258573.1 bifunctional diaminohydroxyphosphoribosylaminopyrimidine deaminase/5-amino-6-(5-phosphoribosylamino)uracil reductase RibD [Alicyclobacillus sendaiensis PA2]
MTEDERYMRMALEVARLGEGQTSPNPMVGALVVRDGHVVGQGAHLMAGTPHAEVHALRMAGDAALGATLYVTLEPCNHHGRTPPCTDAILATGVRRVVVATLDVDPRTAGLGVKRLQEAGIDVTVGVLEEEARELNRHFFHRVTTGRPYVIYKVAMTLSGHVAASNGHSQYVTGVEAREDVHRLRQVIPAIGVGVGTVLADNPELTARHLDTGVRRDRQPLRVVFDTRLRTPPTARLLAAPGRTLVLTSERMASSPAASRLAAQGDVRIVPVPERGGHLDLGAALAAIAAEGANALLLEGGPTIAAALLQDRLIDEVRVYVAPKLLASGLPALSGALTQSMAEAVSLHGVRTEWLGGDLVLTGRVQYREGV